MGIAGRRTNMAKPIGDRAEEVKALEVVISERAIDQAEEELERGPAVARELAPVRVAAELEHGPVVGELEHARVAELALVQVVAEPERDLAEELELDPAAVELERGQAVEALETDHPHDRLALLRGTKSVTAAHRRGQAHLAVEDLAAAVAETTLEPVAAEAVAAWVVAG
jgi:hypothetical protein